MLSSGITSSARQLQLAFLDEPAKIGFFGGIALEEWSNVGHLVEREVVAGLLSQQAHCV